jgi:hypothetical protein
MRIHIPFLPITLIVTTERRPLGRRTISGLLALIAIVVVGLDVAPLIQQWAGDWVTRRSEVERQAQEANRHEVEQHAWEATTLSRILEEIRTQTADHPTEPPRMWVIHGIQYRVGPALEGYLEAAIAYHKRRAQMHQATIGRSGAAVTPESPPEPPPRVPFE